jgi:cysteine desulfurase/selenocysteine lyase
VNSPTPKSLNIEPTRGENHLVSPLLNNQTLSEADIRGLRQNFPALSREIHNQKLVYLDNAATTLKPNCVVDMMNEYYLLGAANIHRGVHYLSEVATQKYEATREKIRQFINAKSLTEVIFTSGTTHAINLVAYSFGQLLSAGDEILISEMEHHSNIVPWQILAERRGLKLKVAPINDRGELDLEKFKTLFSNKTKLVSIVAISNSLGTVNPIKDITKIAHERGAKVLVDGAQAVAHTPVDVQDLDVDFFAFSGHKLYGPTGVGVLYGRHDILEAMPPFMGGGDMIRSVTFEKTTYADLPAKFEPGTPPIAEVIGLGRSIDFLNEIGITRIQNYEDHLLAYGHEVLSSVPKLKFIGQAPLKAGILSFTLGDIHPHDIGTLVDQKGVAIRVGHHCTQPVMKRFNIPATARASLSFYNTKEDLNRLVESLCYVQKVFS